MKCILSLRRSFFLRTVPLALVVAIASIAAPQAALAQDLASPITLRLASGRQMRGHIDRADAETLWLRRGDAEVSIVRPIAWQAIRLAQQQGEELSLEELKARAIEATARRQEAVAKTPAPEVPKWRGVFVEPVATGSPAREVLPPPSAVRSVAADVLADNWDADVEWDGLVVYILPLDRYGAVLPVHATVQVALYAPETRRFIDAPHERGLSIERIGQWTANITPADFGPRGARIELPFQALHPEFDLAVLPHGLVNVKLVVPGGGTFDTTADWVRLRPWSPIRDEHWLDRNRRFFPTEQTGRPQGAYWGSVD